MAEGKEGILEHVTIPRVILGLIVFRFVYMTIQSIIVRNKIKKLGGFAPVRTTYLPYSIDMVIPMMRYALRDQSLEWWTTRMIGPYGRGGHTIEFGVGERIIMTVDPENIKAILATQFKDYGKGENFRKDWHIFLGNGIFATDGTLWHNSRQLIRPQFIKDRVSDLEIFEKHWQELSTVIGGQGRELEALDLFMRYTLDAATDFLLGRSVESIHNPAQEFADAFYTVQRVQGFVAKLGPLNWLIPRRYMGFYKALDKVNDFVNTYVEEALALSQEELEKKNNHDEGYTFLHSIAAYTRDKKTLRDQIVNILLAGRDTTACTLTWIIYHLSLQPHIIEKLRREIENTVGFERPPTYEHLKNMRYLQHIMNEALRLYPVVPFNVRLALHDTTLPTGGGPDGRQPIGILKDTVVGYSPLVMQRRPDLYPPPESGFPPIDKFVPERWDGWTPKTWTYIPFNGGPRICVGQQFALTEMAYTMVRLFQKYETVSNYMGNMPAGLHTDIVLQPSNPIKVGFWEKAPYKAKG